MNHDFLMEKGQAAFEFMILVGVLVVFTIGFLYVIQGNITGKVVESRELEFKEIALIVVDEINLAIKASDGYRREFLLPEKIAGLEYDMDIIEGTVYITSDDGKISMAFDVSHVEGNILKGKNVVRKKQGVIYLNE